MYSLLGKIIYLLSGVWLTVVWHLWPDYSFMTHDPLIGLTPILCICFYEIFPGIFEWVKQHIAQKDSDQSDATE